MATQKTAPETFATLSGQIVYSPKSSEGKGFLPPLLRALTHLTYALGLTEEDTSKDKAAADKVQEEIKGAISHLEKVEIGDTFSSVAKEQLKIFAKALHALNAEYLGWDQTTKVSNLTTLIHRSFGISAMLDRELIGLRNSDPGSSL